MPNSPQVASLLDPAKALTLKFTNDNKMGVLTRVKQPDGSYQETVLNAPQLIKGSQSFEIGLDPGHSPVGAAALLVHADGGWDEPPGWEDEAAQVIGGAPFPYGRDPIGQNDRFNPNTTKPTTVRGAFFTVEPNKAGEHAAPTLTVQGVNKTTTSHLPGNIGVKYLSLWLPAGVNGYVKLPAWQGDGDGTFRTIDNPPPSAAAVAAPKAGKCKGAGKGGK